MKTVNVAIIGTKFMGKAHSNAWTSAPKFFKLGLKPVLKVACGQDAAGTGEFAATWGWQETASDWKKVVERPDIDIIDICTPTYLHKDIVVAAARNGKQIFCEKPIALNYAEAKEMYEAAEKAGVLHYLNHNYRRTPAVAFARQLIEAGKLGRIFHWCGAYLQDWITDPNFPLTWHLQKKFAGAGPHYDLNSHSVDLARYLVGEVDTVSAMMKTFIEERPLPGAGAGTFKSGSGAGEKGKVTVDDASFMVVEFCQRRAGLVRVQPLRQRSKELQLLRDLRQQGQPDLRPGAHERADVPGPGRPGRRAGLPHHPGDQFHPSLRRRLVAARSHHRLRARIHPRRGRFPDRPGKGHQDHAQPV